jgi:hypothetical protein
LAIRKKETPVSAVHAIAAPQTGYLQQSALLCAASPTRSGSLELYRLLRERVPIIDAAIMKTVRLLGTFDVRCDDERAQTALRRFLKTVPVGSLRCGIDAFLSTYFEQLLTYGTAVGEMVVTDGRLTDLFNADLRRVAFSYGKTPLEIVVSAQTDNGRFLPVPYPGLILKSVHDPQPGALYGTSVLQGLPFVSNILMTIFRTTEINWERLGNVRFAVTYKPQNDALDKAYAAERAQQIADAWSRAMREENTVRDFIAVGDVQVQAIGSDNRMLSSEIPVRQLLEQIVAKLGIPPFLLGLSWSSTERMSSQQADILTSEIDAYRRELEPVVLQICETYLRFEGYDCPVEIEWEPLTLQDITALSQAALLDAQREKLRKEIGETQDDI